MNIENNIKSKIMKSNFDPKPGQHKLSEVWANVPKGILNHFREHFSVTTAEEFVHYIASKGTKPKQVRSSQWTELIDMAQKTVGTKFLQSYKRKRKTPVMGAVICQGDPDSPNPLQRPLETMTKGKLLRMLKR